MLAFGFYITSAGAFNLIAAHNSLGILVFVPIAMRAEWRVRNGWPEPASAYSNLECTLSRVIYWVLIVGTLLMPISRMVEAVAGGYSLSAFGFDLIAANADPANANRVVPYS